MSNISRGDVWVANLDPTIGREIKKSRPVIVVSNDIANANAGTVTVVPITSQKLAKTYPFETLLPTGAAGLAKPSKAKADQIRTIDKSRLASKLGSLDIATMSALDSAIKIHLNLS